MLAIIKNTNVFSFGYQNLNYNTRKVSLKNSGSDFVLHPLLQLMLVKRLKRLSNRNLWGLKKRKKEEEEEEAITVVPKTVVP